MKTKQAMLTLITFLIPFAYINAQSEKPNFSGTWKLDKEKSELGGERGEGSGRRMGGMFDFLVIEHNEPKLIIKRKMSFPDGEERTLELKYTTDGKKNNNEGFRGMMNQSKTHWDEGKLITESSMETPMGARETKEVRSLSAGGMIMTVEMTAKGGRGEGTRTLVFNKQPSN